MINVFGNNNESTNKIFLNLSLISVKKKKHFQNIDLEIQHLFNQKWNTKDKRFTDRRSKRKTPLLLWIDPFWKFDGIESNVSRTGRVEFPKLIAQSYRIHYQFTGARTN